MQLQERVSGTSWTIYIVGTYGAGWLGDRFSKPKLLMALYGSRGIAIIAFCYYL